MRNEHFVLPVGAPWRCTATTYSLYFRGSTSRGALPFYSFVVTVWQKVHELSVGYSTKSAKRDASYTKTSSYNTHTTFSQVAREIWDSRKLINFKVYLPLGHFVIYGGWTLWVEFLVEKWSEVWIGIDKWEERSNWGFEHIEKQLSVEENRWLSNFVIPMETK